MLRNDDPEDRKEIMALLKACRTRIKILDVNPDKTGLDSKHLLTPSQDWDKIKSYPRMNKSVKNKFKESLYQSQQLELPEEAPKGRGNIVGIEWDVLLTAFINGKHPDNDHNVARAVIEKLRQFSEIIILESHFPLYGYMCDEGDVYLWRGNVDAIGMINGKYVIVDWKVQDLLEYWENSKTFGAHLHQCLVYARLLQLHLELPDLPWIMIVPISGNDITPGFFRDYPPECIDVLNSFTWSVERPQPMLDVAITNKLFIKDMRFEARRYGNVDPKMLLRELTQYFDPNATVEDMTDAFKLLQIKIV